MGADGFVTVGDGEDHVDDLELAKLGHDDIANAERLIARHGRDLKRTNGLGPFEFDGKRWRLDQDEFGAMLRAQRTARSIRCEAVALEKSGGYLDGDALKEHEAHVEKHQKWSVASANGNRLRAMLDQAWPHLAQPFEAWNSKPDLFNVANGTLDLSSIEPVLRPHRRDDHITLMSGVAYDPEAECPKFRAYIDQVMPPGPEGDRSLQKFLQRVLGSCLIDSARDRVIVVFHGGGSNGKSTVLNAVSAVLGEYSLTAAAESLLYQEKNGSSASPDIARLAGRARLVRVSEPEVGARLAEGAVKGITGGEPIVARKLREDLIEFVPNFKVILSCNNRPQIRGGDDGIWDRILLVPWRTRFSDEDKRTKGPQIVAELHAELPGILNWLIEGLADYRERGGLEPPETVLAASQEYRSESDAIGRFLGDCCEIRAGVEHDGAELYDAFRMWAHDEGFDKPTGVHAFGKKLTDRGFGRRKSSGVVKRLGLELSQEWVFKVRLGAEKAKQRAAAKALEESDE